MPGRYIACAQSPKIFQGLSQLASDLTRWPKLAESHRTIDITILQTGFKAADVEGRVHLSSRSGTSLVPFFLESLGDNDRQRQDDPAWREQVLGGMFAESYARLRKNFWPVSC